MKVNPQQLLDDGYIILREVVPMGQLDELRDCFETLVERQKLSGQENESRMIHREAIGKRRRSRVCFSMASLMK